MEKKDINMLTEEDKFLMQLTKVERLATKLSIMSYMGNFVDNLHLISPVSSEMITSKKHKDMYYYCFNCSKCTQLYQLQVQ